MIHRLANLLRDERGASAVEYALIVSLIVLAMVAALGNTAQSTTNMWNHVENRVQSSSTNS